MKSPFSVVVFSAVDSVLARSTPTAFAAAADTLKGLAGRNVALVFCSGKTRAELEHLSQDLDGSHPYICEHGAAAFIPPRTFDFPAPQAREVAGYQALEFGWSHAQVVETLQRTSDRLEIPVCAFHRMSVESVARECQLSLMQARLAKLREYGELFRIEDARPQERRRLLRALESAHLQCVPDGTFLHAGAAVDMSIGVGVLRGLYRRASRSIVTVGVADETADEDFLQFVEHPVLIQSDLAGERQAARQLRSVGRVTVARDVAEWAETVAAVVYGLQRLAGPAARALADGAYPGVERRHPQVGY